MGAAARAAERAGKTHCDGCEKPWSEVRIHSFGGKIDEPPRVLCGWCSLDETYRRYSRQRKDDRTNSAASITIK